MVLDISTYLIVFMYEDGESGVRVVTGTKEVAEEYRDKVAELYDDNTARLVEYVPGEGDDRADIDAAIADLRYIQGIHP